MTADDDADACPNQAEHTDSPTSYLGWHAWAEQMSQTHTQHRCPTCRRWVIWRPRTTAARRP